MVVYNLDMETTATPAQIGHYNNLVIQLSALGESWGMTRSWLAVSKIEASGMIDDAKARIAYLGTTPPTEQPVTWAHRNEISHRVRCIQSARESEGIEQAVPSYTEADRWAKLPTCAADADRIIAHLRTVEAALGS